jgi:ubiquinone/menaquinone biosynthesis C-methylase UbiE
MRSERDQCAFFCEAPDGIRRLREVLNGVNYTSSGVLEALGVSELFPLRGSDVPLLLRRTNRGTPLDTLIRLFLIGVPVDIEAARRAVRPMELEEWVNGSLLRVDDVSVAATVKLLLYHGLVIAFDPPPAPGGAFNPNHVVGIGGSTLTLANLTVRRHSRLTLDLGTGCGIQAFLAALHSDRVLAVDRNPRAVRTAAFNARLNGLANVECVDGDLFDPVNQHQFDLVVSNPPFVISPETRYIYRDSGLHGDQMCQRIVREVPKYLSDGGYCQILCNWAHIAGEDWRQRLAAWFEGTGCDAWVMRSETRDAAAYASTWIRETERDDPERFAQRFDEWMAYYERERIEAMSAGLITMRRSNHYPNWFRADDTPEKMLGPCGEHVARGFDLQDFLATVRDDQALMDARLCVSPDVRLEQQSAPSAEGWRVSASELRLVRGLAYSGTIDTIGANLVTRCDGKRRVRELLTDVAASLEADLESMARCLAIVRQLIERGFLLPVQLVNRGA